MSTGRACLCGSMKSADYLALATAPQRWVRFVGGCVGDAVSDNVSTTVGHPPEMNVVDASRLLQSMGVPRAALTLSRSRSWNTVCRRITSDYVDQLISMRL